MGAPRITGKVLDYLKAHSNRTLGNDRIARSVGSSTGGSAHALRNLKEAGEPIEFIKIGSGRYIHVRYNDPNAVPVQRKKKEPQPPPATNSVTVGVTLKITLEDGTILTVEESSARELYAKLKHMFGN